MTNAQFAKFIKAGGYQEKRWWTYEGWAIREEINWIEPSYWTDKKWNGTDHPVVGVSWYECIAFCQWLSEISAEKITLPTDEQWQRAAQGNDSRLYPWGDEFDPTRSNSNESAIQHTTSVTNYPNGASPFGVVDMIGNIWEWSLNEVMTVFGIEHSIRGGSWTYNQKAAFITLRLSDRPSNRNIGCGFRLASLISA